MRSWKPALQAAFEEIYAQSEVKTNGSKLIRLFPLVIMKTLKNWYEF